MLLANYLVDIASIDAVYAKLFGKRRRLDAVAHPHFKKLADFTREKLFEILAKKLRNYDQINANHSLGGGGGTPLIAPAVGR